jgi:hypothetical protein
MALMKWIKLFESFKTTTAEKIEKVNHLLLKFLVTKNVTIKSVSDLFDALKLKKVDEEGNTTWYLENIDTSLKHITSEYDDLFIRKRKTANGTKVEYIDHGLIMIIQSEPSKPLLLFDPFVDLLTDILFEKVKKKFKTGSVDSSPMPTDVGSLIIFYGHDFLRLRIIELILQITNNNTTKMVYWADISEHDPLVVEEDQVDEIKKKLKPWNQ